MMERLTSTSEERCESRLSNPTEPPNNQPPRVKVYRTWDEVTTLRHSWDDLLAQSEVSTPFLTYEWVEAWWIAFGKLREPFVLEFLGPTGECMGFAPLCRISRRDIAKVNIPLRTLCFLGTGTGGTTTGLGLIMRRGYEASGACRLLDWLSTSRSEWDILDLHLMPAEWLSTQTLLGELHRRRWFCAQSQATHLIVPLRDTYQMYLKSLSKTMRTELPYKQHRLSQKYRVNVEKVCSEVELGPALDMLFQLNTERWQERGERGSFGTHEKRIFGREMAKRFFSRGWLDFWLLKLDGRIAAIEYGFRYNAAYYPLWVALDTHFHAFSPGTVLRSRIIQKLIRDGVRVYEFMQGDEPYKMRWGPEVRTYTSLVSAAPFSTGSVYLRMSSWNSAARMRASSIPHQCKEGLRSVLPAGMWNVMRTIHNRLRSSK